MKKVWSKRRAAGLVPIEVWYDGCCEPVNPGGNAAYGVVIKRAGEVLWSKTGYVGSGPKISNNVAEYSGVLAALEWLVGNRFEKNPILVRGDNRMSVMQLAGKWRVHGGLYVPFYRRAVALVKRFRLIVFEWIPREENGEADELSKQVLRDRGVRFRIQKED